jgi:uncharacterized protein (DUF697 family)
MEKTPSRYRNRQGYNIKMAVTGEGMDLSRSGRTLVKTAGPTKGGNIMTSSATITFSNRTSLWCKTNKQFLQAKLDHPLSSITETKQTA